MFNDNTPTCTHTKTNGTKCGSPALKGQTLCYFHDEQRKDDCRFGEIDLPFPEDADAIQYSIHVIMRCLLRGTIDKKSAGLLLYALQLASANLKHTSFVRPPEPEPIDVEEIIRQAFGPADSANAQSPISNEPATNNAGAGCPNNAGAAPFPAGEGAPDEGALDNAVSIQACTATPAPHALSPEHPTLCHPERSRAAGVAQSRDLAFRSHHHSASLFTTPPHTLSSRPEPRSGAVEGPAFDFRLAPPPPLPFSHLSPLSFRRPQGGIAIATTQLLVITESTHRSNAAGSRH